MSKKMRTIVGGVLLYAAGLLSGVQHVTMAGVTTIQQGVQFEEEGQ